MKRAQTRGFQLHLWAKPTGFLLSEGRLDSVQEVLRRHAPEWSSGLHLVRHSRDKRTVEITAAGALREEVRAAVADRGPLYHRLAREYGDPAARVLGSAELRGSDPSLLLGVSLDELPIRPSGDIWLWGNWLSLTICRRRVEGVPAAAWCLRALQALCEGLPLAHGYAHADAEYDAKNMSHEGGGLRAIGVDVSRALSGIYWLNFFGQPYRDLIGRERLLTAPAHDVREVDDGVQLMLHPDPQAWDTPEYHSVEGSVLDHLGRQFFFDRQHPNRRTVAPPFALPPRPDPPLRQTITVDLAEAPEQRGRPRRRRPFGQRD